MLSLVGYNSFIVLLDLFVLYLDYRLTNTQDPQIQDKKENKILKMFFSKLIQKLLKKLMNKFSMYSMKLRVILKFGSITNPYGLLIQKRFMRSLEMISLYGKIFLMKFGRIEKHLITVKPKDILVL
jgi:hypothetical protein